MVRKATTLLFTPALALLLTACNSTGGIKMPFEKEKPFVATAVPADFAIVVDENHDTYYARQHIRQQVTVSDAMSTTTYTTRRDYNNSVSDDFSQETPLSAVQLQNMWNDVVRYNLMEGSGNWINWRSDADIYRRNSYTLQIRANGRSRTYTATNGFSGNVRPLILQINAVRLPISQDSKTRVIGGPDMSSPSMPESTPAAAPPATAPLRQPTGQDIPTPPGAIGKPEEPAATKPAIPGMEGDAKPLLQGQSDGITVVPQNVTLPTNAPGNSTPLPGNVNTHLINPEPVGSGVSITGGSLTITSSTQP